MLGRWQKSAAELALMRRSAAIAAASIKLCMQRTRPGVFEFQLAATFGAGSYYAAPVHVVPSLQWHACPGEVGYI